MANNSLFGELGFPELSQDALIKQRTQQESALFNKLVSEQAQNLPQNDRGVFQSFANLGRNLLGKPVASLTEKEKQQFAIMQASNVKMKALQNTEEWKDLSPREKALQSQEAIAQAALDLGDVGTFSQISLQTASKRQAFKLADAELNKLEAGTDATKEGTKRTVAQTDLLKFTTEVTKGGESGAFAVKDGEAFNFAAAPNLVTGKVNPLTGNLETADGQEFQQFLSVSDFDTFADNIAAGVKAGASGGASNTKSFLSNFKERDKARLAMEDIGVQTEIISTVGEVIKDAGGVLGAEQVVGSAGTLVKAADSMWRTFRGSVKNLNLAINVGGVRQSDGTFTGGTNTTLNEMGKDIPIPDEFENNALQAAKYRSAVMQAVYVDARLAEPGARQLSDADIKNAMDRLGVRTNNPAGIMQTLLQNMARRTSGLTSKVSTVGDIAEAHFMPRDRGIQMIFGKNAQGRIDASQKALTELEESIFGAPNEPQPVTTATPSGASDVDVQSIIDSL